MNKDSDVLNDPKLGKVIFRKTSCAACGFYTVNIAWVNEKEEVEYCGWKGADWHDHSHIDTCGGRTHGDIRPRG